jgi:hypothetical protein
MRSQITLHLTLVNGSILVAFMAPGGTLARVVVFTISLIILESVVWVSLGYLGRRQQLAAENIRREIDRISPDEARLRAYQAVDGWLHVARTDKGLPGSLPPEVVEFFSRYKKAQSPTGDVLELGGIRNGFVDVGRSFDGSLLLVRCSDGAMFEFDGEEDAVPVGEPDCPSLFHWVAMNER